jgi:hypothetical protein
MYDQDPDTSYLEQDGFEDRLDQFKRDVFTFVGVRADAEVCISDCRQNGNSLIQEISSGGLWGIESDSGADYFAEVEQEQLQELRGQLHAIGFSNRAITAAFRSVEREDA